MNIVLWQPPQPLKLYNEMKSSTEEFSIDLDIIDNNGSRKRVGVEGDKTINVGTDRDRFGRVDSIKISDVFIQRQVYGSWLIESIYGLVDPELIAQIEIKALEKLRSEI